MNFVSFFSSHPLFSSFCSILNLVIASCLTVHILFVTLLDQLNQLLIGQCQSLTFTLRDHVTVAQLQSSNVSWDREGLVHSFRARLWYSICKLVLFASCLLEWSVKTTLGFYFSPVRFYLRLQWKVFQCLQRWLNVEQPKDGEERNHEPSGQRRNSISSSDDHRSTKTITDNHHPHHHQPPLVVTANQTNNRLSSNGSSFDVKHAVQDTERQLLNLIEKIDLLLQWANGYSRSVDQLREQLQQRLELDAKYAGQLTHLCHQWRSQLADLGFTGTSGSDHIHSNNNHHNWSGAPLQSLFLSVIQVQMKQSNVIFRNCEQLLADDFKRPLKAQSQQFQLHLNRLRSKWWTAAHELQQKMAILRSEQRDYVRRSTMLMNAGSGKSGGTGLGLERFGQLTSLVERKEEEEHEEAASRRQEKKETNFMECEEQSKMSSNKQKKKKKNNNNNNKSKDSNTCNKTNGLVNGKVPKPSSILISSSSSSSSSSSTSSSTSSASSTAHVSFSDQQPSDTDHRPDRRSTFRQKMLMAETTYRDTLHNTNLTLKDLHQLHIQVVVEITALLMDCEKNVRNLVCGYMRTLCPEYEPLIRHSQCEQQLRSLLNELPVEPLTELKFVGN